jgi:hypothetical protein
MPPAGPDCRVEIGVHAFVAGQSAVALHHEGPSAQPELASCLFQVASGSVRRPARRTRWRSPCSSARTRRPHRRARCRGEKTRPSRVAGGDRVHGRGARGRVAPGVEQADGDARPPLALHESVERGRDVRLDSGITTSPNGSIRSRTPRIRSGGTSRLRLGDVVTRMTSSGRPSTRPTARMMSGVSSKPCVVMRPTRAPFRVMSAFVATVLPCLTRSVRARRPGRSRPRSVAALADARR